MDSREREGVGGEIESPTLEIHDKESEYGWLNESYTHNPRWQREWVSMAE